MKYAIETLLGVLTLQVCQWLVIVWQLLICMFTEICFDSNTLVLEALTEVTSHNHEKQNNCLNEELSKCQVV